MAENARTARTGLVIAGSLIAAFFGAATLYGLNAALFDDLPHTRGFEFEHQLATEPLASSAILLLLGGIPTAIGLALLRAGLRSRR